MRIDIIDSNMIVDTDIDELDVVWLDVKKAPFVIYGIVYDEEQGVYVRMPQSIAEQVSEGVEELYIALKNDAVILEPEPYHYPRPVVYYGSSITQGGCASRPGNSYQAIISRKLNVDYVNLGFSGSCKAEPKMVKHGIPVR